MEGKSSKKIIWIVVIVVVLLIIGFAVFAGKSTKTPPPFNPNPNQNSQGQQSAGNFLGDLLGGLIKKWSNRNTTNDSGYVQVKPIDSDGCDALGYNAIGVRCL